MKVSHALIAIVLLGGAFAFYDRLAGQQERAALEETLTPQWDAITAWPNIEADSAVTPDPNRTTTVIVLDDSGSMAQAISDARSAVVSAVTSMDDAARVAVIGLNTGTILEPMFAPDAKAVIRERIAYVPADGSTPLAAAVSHAYDILSQEAARQRSFGKYRIILTTDGMADNESALQSSVAHVLVNSPVELTTIGIGLGNDHILKLAGHTNYISISDIGQLASTLLQVNAEQTSFEQMQSFE